MKSTLLLALASLASLTTASPLEPRQSQRWNDKYIGKPTNFKATQVDRCTYQVAYRRDNGDGRYEKTIRVAHGGAYRNINAASSANGFDFWAEYIGDLIVFHVANACSSGSSGSEPSAFKVYFTLPRGQYTYVNNWTTDPISVTAGPVPAVPGNVRAVRTSNSRQVQVSWTPVAGASGYLIKSRGLTYASELGSDVPYSTSDTVAGGSTSTGIANGGKIQTLAVLAVGSDGRVVSDFTKTPIVSVA